MDRTGAERRIRALEELRVDRGATPAEARTAAAKAAELRRRFGVRDEPRRQATPRPSPRRRQSRPRSPFMPPPIRTDWAFNVQTGKAEGAVKVHRYDGPGSWRIEIDPDP